ncbi:hypothetical protein [Mesoplasma seiffertii]|uniref:hypothetical protein n=1 Tax=Mesoplasma seiffertii TaxID=28224 RepID=UPI00047AE363|nr:hypothetical protein [Mesoplasma seiffertii]
MKNTNIISVDIFDQTIVERTCKKVKIFGYIGLICLAILLLAGILFSSLESAQGERVVIIMGYIFGPMIGVYIMLIPFFILHLLLLRYAKYISSVEKKHLNEVISYEFSYEEYLWKFYFLGVLVYCNRESYKKVFKSIKFNKSTKIRKVIYGSLNFIMLFINFFVIASIRSHSNDWTDYLTYFFIPFVALLQLVIFGYAILFCFLFSFIKNKNIKIDLDDKIIEEIQAKIF